MRCVIIGGRLPEIAFQTITGSLTSDTSYTFSSQPIGTAHNSRLVIVAVAYINSSASSATCTIAGSSATEVSGAGIRSSSGGSTEVQVKMFARTVTSGTTASIVVSTGSADGCWIGVWSAYYLRSATAVDAEAYYASGSTNILDLDVSSRGVACGFGLMPNAVAWTGMTEEHDAITAGVWMTGATYTAGAAESPRTVRINTSPGAGATACAASFR